MALQSWRDLPPSRLRLYTPIPRGDRQALGIIGINYATMPEMAVLMRDNNTIMGDETMIKELELFNKTISNINARINQLNSEVRQKRTEHEQAATKYNSMMLEDSTGAKSYSAAELNKAKMRIDELSSEIAVAKERLVMVEDGKQQQLSALIGGVKKGWERESKIVADKINAVFEAAREHRAKLTLEIQKGNALYRQAQELLSELNHAEYTAGLDHVTRTSALGVPENPRTHELLHSGGFSGGYKKITDNCVLPSEDELNKAYQSGEVPEWIEHYAKTGEVVTDEILRAREVKPEPERSGGVKGLINKVKRAIPKFGQEDIKTVTIISEDHRKSFEEWELKNPSAHVIEVENLNSTHPALTIRYVAGEK